MTRAISRCGWTLCALAALAACSCRGVQRGGVASAPRPPAGSAVVPASYEAPYAALPPVAYTGQPMPPDGPRAMMANPMLPRGMAPGVVGPWTPPGLCPPWPQDEYLADGGDLQPVATVDRDWQISGLNLEDTIAHYDTLDGRTIVEPSNRVFLYSPRFNAVRQVVSLRQDQQSTAAGDIFQPDRLGEQGELQIADSSQQNYQAIASVGRRQPSVALTEQGVTEMSEAIGPRSFHDAFKAYENLSIIRQGIMEGSEAAFLAQGVQAAVTWTHDQAVQIILDHQRAAEEVSDVSTESVFTVHAPPGNPKLRVIKVASTQMAEPGEEVDFTIRFDNIGNQTIGNVTIVDNLTTRLEYVPDSAQSSVEAAFLAQPNEGDSLVLRWEVKDPLKPGDGGIVRFRCRVR